MSGMIRTYSYDVIDINGRIFEVGSLERPRFQAIAGEKDEKTVTVEASTTQELWDVDTSHLANFDWAWFQSDYDVVLEFIVDDDGDVGEVAFTLDLLGTGRAKEYGPPIRLHGDDSFANNTSGFAGTVDVIERITVSNENTSVSAQVFMLLLT